MTTIMERDKMENMNYGNDGQLSLATLLLLGGGRFFGGGGYGGGYGYGPHAGGSPSIADEVAVHNLKTPTCSDMDAALGRQEERTSSLQRDIGEIGRDLQGNLASINRDLLLHGAAAQAAAERQAAETRAELAKCCCETQLGIKGIEKAICDQTSVLSAEGVRNTQSILDTMNTTERDRLNRELGDCKAALSNANQTSQLAGIVGSAVASGVQQMTSQCCCDPCSNGNGHGKSGSASAIDIQNTVIATIRAMGGGGGFTPPGQGKTSV